MRKVSLLLGTLGGALGAYILSNKDLRKEMASAKKPEDAAKVLGKHLQKDSKKFAKEVKMFVESEEVQEKLQDAKKYTMEKMKEAKMGLEKMVKKGVKKATPVMKKEVKRAKKAVKKAEKAATKAIDKAMGAMS